MIKFNELRVSSINKKLIIDVSVLGLDYYTDVYIDKVIIDSQNTFISTIGPSNNPIFSYTIPETPPEINTDLPGATYTTDYGNIKNLRLELTEAQLTNNPVNINLFFVYIITKGAPALDTPQGMDSGFVIGVVGDLQPIYETSLSYLKELNESSYISMGLIDYILKVNALNLAFKTCNYILAIKYWKKFFNAKIPTILLN